MTPIPDYIFAMAKRTREQDNRITRDPIFCVQEKIREYGFDLEYAEGTAWFDVQSGDYEETEPDADGAEELGYRDRWETKTVCFTEEGCKKYIERNGHNHRGELRIYVESLYRNREMTLLRDWLLTLKEEVQ